MSKRIGLALGLGLALALFVSACGVALGPVQFTAGGPAVLSPTIIGLHLPAIHPAPALSVMHELQKWHSVQEQSQALFAVGGCHGFH